MELQKSQKAKNRTLLTSCKTCWESSWGSSRYWKLQVEGVFSNYFYIQILISNTKTLLKSEILMKFMGISVWWMLLDTKTHFKTTAAGVSFEFPSQFAVFFRLHVVAPQPLAMQRLKHQNFHDAKLLEFSLSVKTGFQCFSFWGGMQKLSWNLCDKSIPSTEVKEVLL